ncbi:MULTISPECIES: hypothetical protein [Empedobacter]|uniref:Uncharacterized protein n=1 Tax=Empedobacter falsenii TaxID=343874 RepID=A0A7H9DSS3_9FLAO|nr:MULTISPECIES: hypothetical protein [Empedobacter]MDH2208411.1 hypothetical protein [Empedobacter sp. GD03644]QLL57781.1 hypothetical protein FH779_06680 [Empedobacter falsenii]
MTDEEYLSLHSRIEIYAQILLGILRYTPVKNIYEEEQYRKELTKKLKFEKITDPDLLRACIDLIEDSQYAIENVYKNGLYKKEEDLGEMYLRLYGVLNASYLQLGAILDLNRLFNVSNQKIKKEKFKSLKLIEIRNKLASHTTNYNIPNSNEIDFYKLSQSTLSKWGGNILIVGKDNSEEVDIIEILKEFTKEIEMNLEEITKKELFSRKFKKDHFEWLEFRYNFIHNN